MLLLFMLSTNTPAQPSADDTATMSEAALQAEYHRKAEEMHRFAQKQLWPAVERTYRDCEATGAALSLADHHIGAEAARIRGDMAIVRERYLRALALDSNDRETIFTLFDLDTKYAKIQIEAFEGARLSPVKRPFDAVQSRAIDFATERIASTGSFQGLLPRGDYRIAQTTIGLWAKPLPTVVVPAKPNSK